MGFIFRELRYYLKGSESDTPSESGGNSLVVREEDYGKKERKEEKHGSNVMQAFHKTRDESASL